MNPRKAELETPPIPHQPLNKKAISVPKVLQIINSSVMGGGQRHVLWLTRELNRKHDFQTQIACGSEGEMWREFHRVSHATHDVPLRHRPLLFSLLKLYRILKFQRIQVAHTHGGIAGLWGRLIAIFARVPAIIHTLHGIHYLNYQNPFTRGMGIMLERLLSRFTDMTIYVSPSNFRSGQRFRLSPISKSIMIRNGVDVSPLKKISSVPSHTLFHTPPGGFHIGCIARFDRVKGHAYLIKAFARIAPGLPSTFLIFVGNGPEKQRCQKLVKELALENRVRFLNLQEDIFAVIQALDLMVLPSLWEGLSLTVLEAMAAGCPIVASQTEGIVDLLYHRHNAWLVPPADIAALAEAIETMITHPGVRASLAQQAQEDFRKENQLETMVQTVKEVYREALGKKGFIL